MVTTVNGENGYQVVIDTDTQKVTVSRGETSKVYDLPWYVTAIHDQLSGPTAENIRNAGGNPRDFFSMAGWPIRHCARAAIESAIEEVEAERVRQADADQAAKLAAEPQYVQALARAAETGKPQCFGHWMETRRAKECGEWGEYQFSVSAMVRPDGSTFTDAVNCY